jgi:hypothetical protein
MSEFASAGLTAGQLNAIVKKLGGHDMALRFLRDELSVSEPTRSGVGDEVDYKKLAQFVTPEGRVTFENFQKCRTPKWREEDGVIYFSVTSDGTTGKDWITRLESKNFRAGDYTKQLLCLQNFKPTTGVTTEVAVLKGMLFEGNRITKKIRAEAKKRKLSKPNAELACLIRDKFTDKEIEAMGLWWIVAMHEPISGSGGDLSLLGAHCLGGGRWLDACGSRPDSRWDRGVGFAFVSHSSQL